jgi:hypothetical protein
VASFREEIEKRLPQLITGEAHSVLEEVNVPPSGQCKLIGIIARFQCGVDVAVLEAAVLQKARLPCAVLEIRRPGRAEALAAHGRGGCDPVDVGSSQDFGGLMLVDAALGELGADPHGSLTLGNATSNEAVGKAGRCKRAAVL